MTNRFRRKERKPSPSRFSLVRGSGCRFGGPLQTIRMISESFLPMTPQTTPIRLNLKKDERLEIDWQDGVRGVYTISYLRAMCPCAQCKLVREGDKAKAAEATSTARKTMRCRRKRRRLR